MLDNDNYDDDWFVGLYDQDWPGGYKEVPRQEVKKKPVEIIEELLNRERYTPDFSKLRLYENIPVFVYDQLRRNGTVNFLMRESKYLGCAVTSHDFYTMKGYAQPVVLEEPKKSSPLRGRIKGEVYAVPPETILVLDKQKFNGRMNYRKMVTVFLNEQTYVTKQGKKHPSIKAWMYLDNPIQWNFQQLPTQARYQYAGNPDRMFFDFVPEPRNNRSSWNNYLDRMIG